MGTLKISKTFLDDHESRGLPMPNIVKTTKAHYFIEINWNNDGYADLYDDAEFYQNPRDFDKSCLGICLSAKALVKKMKETI